MTSPNVFKNGFENNLGQVMKIRASEEFDLRFQNDVEVTLKNEPYLLIPPGVYEVGYTGSEKRRYFGATKLYCWFEVVTQGPHFGASLFKAYNWYEKLPMGSDLAKDLLRLYGKRGRKNMKLSLALFRNKIIEVVVRKVTLDRKQVILPEHLQYSVVDKILGIAAGNSRKGNENV